MTPNSFSISNYGCRVTVVVELVAFMLLVARTAIGDDDAELVAVASARLVEVAMMVSGW